MIALCPNHHEKEYICTANWSYYYWLHSFMGVLMLKVSIPFLVVQKYLKSAKTATKLVTALKTVGDPS